MKSNRRLRGLVPDLELVRRRAAGEPLRALASDYGVAHTTLGRHFARPQVKAQLREQARLLRLERRAARAERAAEQQLEREVRRRAKQQAACERAEARRVAAVPAQIARRRPRARGAHARWLDERDLARPPTRAELHSQLDDIGAAVVAAGSGIEAIVEATDLRTRANVFCSIDPAILIRALANDSAAAARTDPSRDRLRRLHPDPDLIRRRAAGEPLRLPRLPHHPRPLLQPTRHRPPAPPRPPAQPSRPHKATRPDAHTSQLSAATVAVPAFSDAPGFTKSREWVSRAHEQMCAVTLAQSHVPSIGVPDLVGRLLKVPRATLALMHAGG